MLRPHMDKRVISDEHEFIAFKGNCAEEKTEKAKGLNLRREIR